MKAGDVALAARETGKTLEATVKMEVEGDIVRSRQPISQFSEREVVAGVYCQRFPPRVLSRSRGLAIE
ncbi:hypothetical protein D3C83_51660 [compost metagenome]